MKAFGWIVLCVALSLVISCGEDPPAVDTAKKAKPDKKQYSIRAVPDPAMERKPLEKALDSAVTQAPDPDPVPVETEPENFAVDGKRGRVFFPDRGWLSVDEFWEIYYNRPQDLPDDMNHESLEVIRPENMH
ncbi:MAG: hypothetical protein GY703_14085 [Gammaproteobacteria bacterium]|nr:hypothetical protein [Gammaproteobacteria bacterium]